MVLILWCTEWQDGSHGALALASHSPRIACMCIEHRIPARRQSEPFSRRDIGLTVLQARFVRLAPLPNENPPVDQVP